MTQGSSVAHIGLEGPENLAAFKTFLHILVFLNFSLVHRLLRFPGLQWQGVFLNSFPWQSQFIFLCLRVFVTDGPAGKSSLFALVITDCSLVFARPWQQSIRMRTPSPSIKTSLSSMF